MSLRIVEIQWIDSKSGPNQWEYLDELPTLPPVACTTVGYLLEDTAQYKTVAQSLSDSQVHGRITIPTACIKRIRRPK